MFCNEAIRLSRPNGAMNQGSPAAGTNTMSSVPCTGRRSARHVLDRLVAQPVEFLIAGTDFGNSVAPLLGNDLGVGMVRRAPETPGRPR